MRGRNHYVTIERRGTSQDAAGQVQETWTTTTSVWASINPVIGKEYFNASGERSEVTHKISFYYGPTVAPRDRIVYGSRTFDIKSVINVGEKNKDLLLMCVENTV